MGRAPEGASEVLLYISSSRSNASRAGASTDARVDARREDAKEEGRRRRAREMRDAPPPLEDISTVVVSFASGSLPRTRAGLVFDFDFVGPFFQPRAVAAVAASNAFLARADAYRASVRVGACLRDARVRFRAWARRAL